MGQIDPNTFFIGGIITSCSTQGKVKLCEEEYVLDIYDKDNIYNVYCRD